MRVSVVTVFVETDWCPVSVLAVGSAYWPYVKTITSTATGARTTPALSGRGGAVMSLHVLHAGSGYRYLLRSTAAGDGANPADGLAAYYAATGTPSGVWVGGGLAGLNDGHGLPDGLLVDETTLGSCSGTGTTRSPGSPSGGG